MRISTIGSFRSGGRSVRALRYAAASYILILTLSTLSGCAKPTSQAAFCGPDFTGAIERLAKALPNSQTPDDVGKAGTAVVRGHDAGCAS